MHARLALASFVLVATCACITSFPTVTRAKTLDPGTVEVAGYSEGAAGFGSSTPGLGFSWRAGLIDGVDVGMRASSISGAEVSGKFRLIDTSRFTLSLMPAVTTWSPINPNSRASVSVLFGLNLGERVELVLAPVAGVATFVQTEFGGGGFSNFEWYRAGGTAASAFVLVGSRLRLGASVGANYVEPLRARPFWSTGVYGRLHLQMGLGVLWTIGPNVPPT